MYVESKPTTIHVGQPTAPRERSLSSLRRPKTALNQKSSGSSCLRGMEQTVPSFQAFIETTPPVSVENPLELQAHKLHPSRTSSVYSRTISQWAPTSDSWSIRGFLSQEIFLQPSTYSASTPELTNNERQKYQDVTMRLQPRVYAPLLRSPSPSPSPSVVEALYTESTTSLVKKSSRERLPSNLLPPIESLAALVPHRVKSISLDRSQGAMRVFGLENNVYVDMQAKAAKEACCQNLHKSRSFEGLGAMSVTTSTPPLSSSPLAHSWQGRWPEYDEDEVSISEAAATSSCWAQLSLVESYLRDSKLSDSYFGMDAASRAASAAIAKRHVSDLSVVVATRSTEDKALDFEDYENRDRRSTSLTASGGHLQVLWEGPDPFVRGLDSATLQGEASRQAQEYHSLMPSITGQSVPAVVRKSFDGKDIRLTPQPLFFNPRQVSKQRVAEYTRLRNLGASASNQTSRLKTLPTSVDSKRNNSLNPDFPLKLSLTPEVVGSRGTSESISMSSSADRTPRTGNRKRVSRDKPSTFVSILKTGSPKASFLSNGPVRDTQIKSYATDHDSATLLHVPLVGATIVATRAEAEAAFNTPSDSPRRLDHDNEAYAKNAARSQFLHVGGRMVSLTNAFHRMPSKTIVISAPLLQHMDERSSNDRVKIRNLSMSSPIFQRDDKRPSVLTDNQRSMKKQTSIVAHKRPSLLAHVVDKRRESKANKRREELKKTIRRVPDIEGESDGLRRKTEHIGGCRGPSLRVK